MPSQGVDLVRQGYIMARAALSEKPEVTNVEDRAIPGPAGDIPVRIYTPAGEEPYPIFVYYHGGGWVIGDLETSDGISRAFANAGACIVVSVDYRLAPEHKFPAAIDDAFAALNWVAEHAVEIGGDPDYALLGDYGDLTFHAKRDNFRFQLMQMVVDQATFESVDIPGLYPAGYTAQGTGLSVIGFHAACFLIAGDILRKLGRVSRRA